MALEAFFEDYRRALVRGDVAAILRAYRTPLPVVRPDRVRTVETVEELREELAKIVDFHRWSGMADLLIDGYREDGFPEGLTLVSLTWRPLDADGAEIARIDVTYAVRPVRDGARIAAVVAHNEERRRQPIIREALSAMEGAG
ncbi:MAG: hypothetical protein EA355_14210 [Rhodobacteraceae bacterium]|nr:MAG: hypothetical protein EA355_14210 [Paracoccaceae bacterium]